MLRLVILISVLTFSCKSQKNSQDDSGMNIDNDLVLVLEDGYFASDSPLTMTINDQKSLNSFFAKVNRTRKPGLPVPIIDFTTKTVIVFCTGEQKGSERLKLVKTHETANAIEISLRKVKSKNEAMVSYPFFVYELTKTSKAISFK